MYLQTKIGNLFERNFDIRLSNKELMFRKIVNSKFIWKLFKIAYKISILVVVESSDSAIYTFMQNVLTSFSRMNATKQEIIEVKY